MYPASGRKHISGLACHSFLPSNASQKAHQTMFNVDTSNFRVELGTVAISSWTKKEKQKK